MRGLAGVIPILDHYIARRMRSIYESWPFQAVHAHDLYLVGGALRGGCQLGVKVIADLHENWVAALKHYMWQSVSSQNDHQSESLGSVGVGVVIGSRRSYCRYRGDGRTTKKQGYITK